MDFEAVVKKLTTPWAKAEFIPNFPEDEYHATEALSSGRVRRLLQTPAHFRSAFEQPPSEPTPALLFGRYFHKAVLEGDDFAKLLITVPEFSGEGSRAKKKEWLESQHPDAILMTQEDIDKIVGMMNSVLSHEKAMKLIKGAKSRKELTGVFNYQGYRCKMRADIFNSAGVIADLKTTADASPEEFYKSAWGYGYALQAAWYLLGASTILGTPVQHFCWIAVEKTPPYAVAVHEVIPQMLELGERQLRIVMKRLNNAIKTGVWDGYSKDAYPLLPPPWAHREIEEIEAREGIYE